MERNLENFIFDYTVGAKEIFTPYKSREHIYTKVMFKVIYCKN